MFKRTKLQAFDVMSTPYDFFLCPISLDLMLDPVILHTGHTYDRKSIQRWLDEGHTTCPITMEKLSDLSLTPNRMLHRLIADWIERRRRKQERRDEDVLNKLAAFALNQQSTFLESVENLREIRLSLDNSGVHRRRVMGCIEAQSMISAIVNVLTTPKVDEEVCAEIIFILVQLKLNGGEIEGLKEEMCARKLLDLLHNSKVETRRNAAKLLASLDARWLWMRFNSAMECGIKRLLCNGDMAHEALILLREMVMMNCSSNVGCSLSYACEPTQGTHLEQRGGARVSCTESEDMQRWIVEKGFVSMIDQCLLRLNGECCEMALEVMEKICNTRSSCQHGRIGAESLAKIPSIIANVTTVLMRHSEKCTLYGVLILLGLLKQRLEEKGRLVADMDMVNVCMCREMRCKCRWRGKVGNVESDHRKILERQHCDDYYKMQVPGLPKQLLLILQSNRTPAVKKRCAELLKLLDSHAGLSYTGGGPHHL